MNSIRFTVAFELHGNYTLIALLLCGETLGTQNYTFTANKTLPRESGQAGA